MSAPLPTLTLAATSSPHAFEGSCLFVPVWPNAAHNPVWNVTSDQQEQLLGAEMQRMYGQSGPDCLNKLLNSGFNDDLAYMAWGPERVLVLLRSPSGEGPEFDKLASRAANAVHLDLAYEAYRQQVAGADLVIRHYEDMQFEQQMGA